MCGLQPTQVKPNLGNDLVVKWELNLPDLGKIVLPLQQVFAESSSVENEFSNKE